MRIFTFALLLTSFLTSCSNYPRETLNIYVWGDFLKQEVIEEFEKKCNCRVVVDTYDSNESMYAKLKSGASGYDLIFPTGYVLEVLQNQKMLHTLDKTLLPNLKNIDTYLLKELNAEENENSVPYALTFTAIAYRSDKVKNLESSWTVFNRRDLKGRMTLLNDMREVLGAALKVHGFSINTINPQEIETAKKSILAWKKNIAKFESEQYKNGLASAEYLVVQGYSSDIIQLKDEDEMIALVLPEEGSVFSCDYIAIAKDAPSVGLAHAFINFLLEPEIAAKNMEANYYLSPNKPAFDLLSDDLRQNPALFPPQEFIEKSEMIRDLGEDVRLYIKAWNEIKSG
ncbi:MAG TPA: spermidine/putrescine ABC transporter substrate-binding protein [Parachlamydiaceae bacterium]|nr:spermidine/putrescine ABC transporter substrate-binding protein [Parachlamydiaceae bacterium]